MQIKRKGITLKIFHDSVDSPRKENFETNIGEMVCFHRRLLLGDTHEFTNPEDFDLWKKENADKIACILPLYLLDHSNLELDTTPFQNKYDSGQVGYIYTTWDKAKLYGYEDLDEIEGQLKQEVFEYGEWLAGRPDYYAFLLTDENDVQIQCLGAYPNHTGMKFVLEDMKSDVDKDYHFLFDKLIERQIEEEL